MSRYILAPDADTNGTYLLDEVSIAPLGLVNSFGRPSEGDGYKVSGQFVFRDELENVFTLYDWKSTTLYEDNVLNGVPDIPTPDEYWTGNSTQTFSIGGREGQGDVQSFKNWLLEETR